MGANDTIIKDAGACISIIRNGATLLVAKQHIKTIDTIGLDIVRLNIGEGPLRNIYINRLDMIEPGTKDAADLQGYINSLLGNSSA